MGWRTGRRARRIAGWLKAFAAVLFVVGLAVAARLAGASWQGIVWGFLGLAAFSAVAGFFEWLLHWRPDRRDAGPPPDAGRPE